MKSRNRAVLLVFLVAVIAILAALLVSGVLVLVLAAFVVVQFKSADIQPFIYFQF